MDVTLSLFMQMIIRYHGIFSMYFFLIPSVRNLLKITIQKSAIELVNLYKSWREFDL